MASPAASSLRSARATLARRSRRRRRAAAGAAVDAGRFATRPNRAAFCFSSCVLPQVLDEPAHAAFGFHRADLHRGVEAAVEVFDVRRDQVGEVAHVAGDGFLLVSEALGEEDFLDDVEPVEAPGFEVVLEVVAEQPVIHEGLVLLVLEVRRDDRPEELGVLVVEEEAQLVAGVLGVLAQLLRRVQVGPVGDERELLEGRVAAERGQQAIGLGHSVADLEAGGRRVGDSQTVFGRHGGDEFLLGIGFGRVQAAGEPKLTGLDRRVFEGNVFQDGASAGPRPGCATAVCP